MRKVRKVTTVAQMALLFTAGSTFSASAHSWYPRFCCSGMDCGKIESMTRMPDGSLIITNEHGDTATFPPGFHIKEPEDGGKHACISKYSKQPICLFLPAEI